MVGTAMNDRLQRRCEYSGRKTSSDVGKSRDSAHLFLGLSGIRASVVGILPARMLHRHASFTVRGLTGEPQGVLQNATEAAICKGMLSNPTLPDAGYYFVDSAAFNRQNLNPYGEAKPAARDKEYDFGRKPDLGPTSSVQAEGLNHRITRKRRAATAADAGIVRIHAQTIFPATPQRTADKR
jgi:hypothetical protein